MKKEEFTSIRKKLGRTQKEIAHLLGISIKTVESYEQGLRNIPVNIKRIIYYLLFKLNKEKFAGKDLCWNLRKCPKNIRNNCVAWLAKEGLFCWFITGRVCNHNINQSDTPIDSCFHCSFFKSNLGKI